MSTGKRFLIDISLDFVLDEFEIWPEELDEGFQVNAKAVLKELTSGYSILDKLRDLGIEIKPEHVTVGELGDPSSTVHGDYPRNNMDYREQKLEQWKQLVTNGDNSLDPYAVYAEALGVDRKTAKTKIIEEIFGDNETPPTCP